MEKELDYHTEIRRSSRRSLSLQITEDGTLLIRAPYRMSERTIMGYVSARKDWIEANLQKVAAKKLQMERIPKLTEAEIKKLTLQAKSAIPERVEYYARQIGVNYGRISIRHQRTRWGSCSGKGNLNFNCLLVLAPPQVLDYVVVHELCHLLEMNHSKRFWSLVEETLPDYRGRRKWLREHGEELIGRLPD